MLWIKGKPGAGKSTVLKHALETAERESKKGIILASFFFHGRGVRMQKNTLGLFRSLLHQILKKNRDLLSNLTSLYKDRCETEGKFAEKWEWDKKQLQSFFKQNVVDAARIHPIRIYIDALDECGEDLATELIEFFRFFAAPISICFSCRHYPFVALEGGNEVCVEQENKQDIVSYINDKINTHVQRVAIAQVIRNEMVSRSKGNFQWVVLVLPRVLKMHKSRKSLLTIQTMIRNIPAELNELYTNLLKFVDEYERAQSLRLLQWISFAFRPLTLRELRLARVVSADTTYRSLRECRKSELYVDTDEDMERIVCDLSKGLAEVIGNGSERVAQFVHQSVKDFLLEQEGFQILDHASEGTVVGRGHFWLSRSCIKYFLMEEVQDSVHSLRYERRATCTMLEYPVKYLFRHVQAVDVADMSQSDLLALDSIPTNGILLQSWFEVYQRLEPFHRFYGQTLLHVASKYNLIGVANAILARNLWADHKDIQSRTPLFIAAAKGHKVLVETLVSREDVDVNSKCDMGKTPLFIAAKMGHIGVVEMLIDRDDVNVDSKDRSGFTPLSIVAERGHKAIAEILMIRDDIDVNSKNRLGETPLSLAAKGGHKAIITMLLNRNDVKINSENHWGDTPLSIAAGKGHEAVVKMLMTRDDVDADSKNCVGETPLSLAAEKGYEAIAKMIMTRDEVDVNSENQSRLTPLSKAGRSGHTSLAKVLFERGLVSNLSNIQLNTAFIEAASHSHYETRKLLLPEIVDVNARDKFSRRPLSYTAAHGF